MSYDTTQFEKDLNVLGVTLTKEQIDQFLKYYELLVEWNGFMNLTAITDYDEVMKKHFVDSLSLIKTYDVSKKVKVIDVGTGAGFPGLALKIAYPNLQVTLLDSLNKRINFLSLSGFSSNISSNVTTPPIRMTMPAIINPIPNTIVILILPHIYS